MKIIIARGLTVTQSARTLRIYYSFCITAAASKQLMFAQLCNLNFTHFCYFKVQLFLRYCLMCCNFNNMAII